MTKVDMIMVFVPWIVAVSTMTYALIMSDKLLNARVELAKLKYQLKGCKNESRASE